MGTWNSRGLRGSTLEDMINRTNERYLEKHLALIQKIPTPITPVKMDKEHRQITLAYFEKRSTVDYIGAVQGIPVCFDAKECVADTFPLQNVHEHQVRFMRDFEQQEGLFGRQAEGLAAPGPVGGPPYVHHGERLGVRPGAGAVFKSGQVSAQRLHPRAVLPGCGVMVEGESIHPN